MWAWSQCHLEVQVWEPFFSSRGFGQFVCGTHPLAVLTGVLSGVIGTFLLLWPQWDGTDRAESPTGKVQSEPQCDLTLSSLSSLPLCPCSLFRLALYVYEYLLHVGAQKSAQTFLSEIRWEKNITLGEPPGFLHSWWCVFWDLYCAAPERRDTCEHSSEAKAFHDYSAAAAPSPVLGNIPPNDGMPGGPIPPGFFQPFMSPRYAGGPRPPIRMGNQPPGGVPGTQPLLPNSMDPTRQQGHPNMGGSMQRMNPPRGMGPMGPGPQNYGSGMRPPPNSLGPAMPGINMGPGAGRPWPNPNSANSIPYSSSSPGTYVGPPGGGGPPGTPIMPSPADSTNSSDNIYTMINPVPPGGSRSNFPMGPGSDGPMGGMGGMEPHHMNGSLGSGDIDGLPKNSPNNISGISNPPGTPRDDGELGGNFLHSFQNDNYSPSMTMSV
nr:single-stranded DNA-binding protein 3 isoform X4 [Myodes glareolus]